MRVCSVTDCDRPMSARGWCALHYERWRRHGDLYLRIPHFHEAAQAALDEALFLFDMGEPVERIPAKCRPGGMKAQSLARTAQRHGHLELARALWCIDARTRRQERVAA